MVQELKGLQGQKLDAVTHILGVERLGKQLHVTDRLSDGDTELVRIDQPVKIAARTKPFIANSQQVAILTEQHPLELRCPLKQ